MLVRTSRLAIRPLCRQDVDAVAVWKPFSDPLAARDALLADESPQDRDLWFALRTSDPTRKEFAIQDAAGQVIGRISLRQIDGQGCARLGVAIGVEFMDRGYGSEALTGFLDWYFGEGGFVKIVLDVSAANLRAVHVYRKLGFRHVTDFYRPVGAEAAALLDDPHYADIRHLFKREDDQTLVLFYEMELGREAWQKRMR